MPKEEFKIIIKKNGEVWVDLGGLEPQRVRNYSEIFEEAIGPIKERIEDSGAPPSPGTVRIQDQDEDSEQEREKFRNG